MEHSFLSTFTIIFINGIWRLSTSGLKVHYSFLVCVVNCMSTHTKKMKNTTSIKTVIFASCGTFIGNSIPSSSFIMHFLLTCITIIKTAVLITCMYTCQLSHLQVENFDLMPAHACGPISHTWLKNVSCCCLAWHNFQKYVNSDPCKERKPCVKWINDNTFLAISDFVDKRTEVFGRLRTSSGIFGNDCVIFKNPALPG